MNDSVFVTPDNVKFEDMVREWYTNNKPYFDTRLYTSSKRTPTDDQEKESNIISIGVANYQLLKDEFDKIVSFNISNDTLVNYMSYITNLYLTIPLDKIENITYYMILGEYVSFDKNNSSMLIPLMYLISYSDFHITAKDCSILRKLIDDGMDEQSLNTYANTLRLIKDLYFMIMPRSVFKGKETFPSSYVWFMNEIHKLNIERSIANRKLSVSESDIIKDIVSIIKIRNIVL